MLAGIPRVVPYFDDVLIMGPSREKLTERLREVLQRFDKAGVRVKREKCQLGVSSINLLGYQIDDSGIHPFEDKVKAIHDVPIPKCNQDLQEFLGRLNFYHIFLKDKATIAEPLHHLLDKGAQWKWTCQHNEAFQGFKKLPTSDSVLVHYGKQKPLSITCNASPFGVGTVLSHTLLDGTDTPVAFYSRTMTSTERNYAQIDKEALAIIAGVKKIHNYVYGHKFEIRIDHKPLLRIFTTDKPTPILSPCMQHWSIMLNAYDYILMYKPGKTIANADALSRLPLQIPDCTTPLPAEVLMLESMPEAPLQDDQIARITEKDSILARVLNWETVFARNYRTGPQRVQSKIVSATGPISYTVQTDNEQVCRRHVDQLYGRSSIDNPTPEQPPSTNPPLTDMDSLGKCLPVSTTLFHHRRKLFDQKYRISGGTS
ncbi:hypothetical protein Y1Q_0021468 [Alligator mississippiensis]|uniref:ribonuclease H n=1 Tax=Alligator mississippiensis TaxID=8496 RepID=A0A151PA33_ALLMI|nr:hypothetical protein Y1Q_0021468 [Alligator mississippiensis]